MCRVIAQENNSRSGSEIVKAELSFAEQAKNHGVSYAFLNNLDTNGLIVNGNKIINGIKAYKKVISDSDELLTWRPRYAYTNQSNDFGFTSGPYLYFANKNEHALASGLYFSIWNKNSEGNFKVQFDGGVNHKEVKFKINDITSIPLPEIKKYSGKINNHSNLYTRMDEFEHLLKKNEPIALKKFASEQILILRPDAELLTNYVGYINSNHNKNYIQNYFRKKLGDGYDQDHKIYYVYGNLTSSEQIGNEINAGFYITVWESQSNDWKIIADISQYKSL